VPGLESGRDTCLDCGHTREEHDDDSKACYGGSSFCECFEFQDEAAYQEARKEWEAERRGSRCRMETCGNCGGCA
jgi:hypothetical protein